MLYLYTGLPGHGKTLNAIHDILTEDVFKGRDVYYYGIPELTLDWQPIEDPKLWYQLPEGSVIVIDEAQRVFPVRSASSGKSVPQQCTEFETHRHKAYDVMLITQDARLLDHHVRRLVGCYRHVRRPVGMQRCIIQEWERVVDPNEYHQKQEAIRTTQRAYPKEIYGKYRSATMHTVKRKLPKKLLIFPVALVGLVLCCWVLFGALFDQAGVEESVQIVDDQLERETQNLLGIGESAPGAQLPPAHTVAHYALMHSPRFAEIPYSAPIYDAVREPVTWPKPQCVELGSECRCYSQQATRMNIPAYQCREILTHGFFDYTRPDNTNTIPAQKQTIAKTQHKSNGEGGTAEESGARSGPPKTPMQLLELMARPFY